MMSSQLLTKFDKGASETEIFN